MPSAPPEPTVAARVLPPSLPARDKRAADAGFAALVDDQAPVRAEPRPQAEAGPANRDMRNIPARESPRGMERSAPDAADAPDTAKPDGNVPNAAPDGTEKPPQPVAGVTTDIPLLDAPAIVPQKDPAAPDAGDPAATPDPANATQLVPLPAPPALIAAPVVASQKQQVQAAAPLSIAAAGLASAKAVATEPSATPDAAAARAKTATAAITTGFRAPEAAAETSPDGEPVQSPALSQPAEAKPEAGKPEAKAAQPAPAGAENAVDAAQKPAERPAEPTPARSAESTGGPAAPTGPAPTHQAAAATPAAATPDAPTPAVQMTASVATAQPVPLNGLAVQLAARATTGATRFEIRLDPAELGRIDVRLDIDRHGQVTSHLTVEKPETLAMLRQDSPQLQRALTDAGFKTTDGGMQFSLGDQSQSQAQQQNTEGGQRHAHRLFIQDDDISIPALSLRDYGRLAAARSGVDISV